MHFMRSSLLLLGCQSETVFHRPLPHEILVRYRSEGDTLHVSRVLADANGGLSLHQATLVEGSVTKQFASPERKLGPIGCGPKKPSCSPAANGRLMPARPRGFYSCK